jgi:hypothetical protein
LTYFKLIAFMLLAKKQKKLCLKMLRTTSKHFAIAPQSKKKLEKLSIFENAHVDYCLIEDDNPFVGNDLRYQKFKENG